MSYVHEVVSQKKYLCSKLVGWLSDFYRDLSILQSKVSENAHLL
jgi:hypothetical protein